MGETWYLNAAANVWAPLDTCDIEKWKYASQAFMKQSTHARHICQVNMVDSLERMHGELKKAFILEDDLQNEIMCSKTYKCAEYMSTLRKAWFYSKCNCTEVGNCFDTRAAFICDTLYLDRNECPT